LEELLVRYDWQPLGGGFQVLRAVTMKNVVFWDKKTEFVPRRKHITSPLQSPAD
jgi:hypothetical protein